MLKHIKLLLSKTKFALGLSPIIGKNKSNSFRSYIPKPYKAVCLISADFEMAWAWRYSKKTEDPLQKAIHDGHTTRENVPTILGLCDRYNIPITWATVGHLFLESCSKTDGEKHPELPRLSHFENQYWKFDQGDWFDYDPGTDYKTDPAWYAPDLIKDILSRKTRHEIGSHTFSHVDCRDSVDDGKVFLAEMQACIEIAKEWGIELKSFVHPGHTIGNLDTLSNLGFTSYRTDYGNILGFPKEYEKGLWEFENTAGLDWRQGWSTKYHIHRYITIIKRAIRHRKLCVLWFHPSFDPRVPETLFPELFKFLDNNRDDVWVTTHGEYAEWLNQIK